MNTWNVFFLCPGGVLVFIFCVIGIRTDKQPTGQKSFVRFGTLRRDTEFGSRVSILFLRFFPCRRRADLPTRIADPIGTAARFLSRLRLSTARLVPKPATQQTWGGLAANSALLFALVSLFR
jgi:hypothetical protein